MTQTYRIALDAMGGDLGCSPVVTAAVKALETYSDIELILVGQEDALRDELARQNKKTLNDRLTIHHASQVVTMDEPPALALKKKKDSSMRVSINLVKEGKADACISSGNTGALMATARFVLKMLPGVDRPAITATFPSKRGHTHILDLGANVDSSADQLYQFAVMGSELATAVDDAPSPTVGLLNIGHEAIKGNELVKEADSQLRQSDLNYIGYVEGDDLFIGDVDVVVCDGFVGNVALKSSEGVAKLISSYIKEEFTRNFLSRIVGLLALPILARMRRRADPRRYNGASLLGLKGIVIKSHGGSDSVAFGNAIKIARIEVIKNVPKQISEHIEQTLKQRYDEA
jgi:glycerol-3-phosphate acyltransferase PlsX